MAAKNSNKLLIVTKGDYITRLILDQLLVQYSTEDLHVIIVSADSAGRSGFSLMKATIRDYAFSYFWFELVQFVVFKLAERINPRLILSVRSAAQHRGIKVTQTTDINDPTIRAMVKKWQPAVLVSAKCPQKINQELIDLFSLGALNVHGSLLPKYAGRAPHFWAMANGENDIGFTIHGMTERFDHGHIFSQQAMGLDVPSTVFSMMVEVAKMSGKALPDAVAQLIKGELGTAQNESARSYFSSPTKQAVTQLKSKGYKLFHFKQLLTVLKDPLNKKPT